MASMAIIPTQDLGTRQCARNEKRRDCKSNQHNVDGEAIAPNRVSRSPRFTAPIPEGLASK